MEVPGIPEYLLRLLEPPAPPTIGRRFTIPIKKGFTVDNRLKDYTITDIERAYDAMRAESYADHDITIGRVLNWLNREANQYVQVELFAGRGQHRYTYHAPGARVGDWVVLPRADSWDEPKLRQVVALGRGSWKGPTKSALLVPAEFAGAS